MFWILVYLLYIDNIYIYYMCINIHMYILCSLSHTIYFIPTSVMGHKKVKEYAISYTDRYYLVGPELNLVLWNILLSTGPRCLLDLDWAGKEKATP